MKTQFPSIKPGSTRVGPYNQRGVALADFALALVLGAVAIAAALGAYLYSKSSISSENFGEKTMMMVSDIQKHWAASGSYATVTPAEVNKLAVIRAPLRYDGANIIDGWGNTMTLSGSATSFALTVGGATTPIQQDECANVVARLAPVASVVRIGADAAVTAGVASGGTLYKSGGVITQAGLTDGCSAASTKIAAQFR